MLQSFFFVKKSNYFTLPPCYFHFPWNKLLTTGSFFQNETLFFYPSPRLDYFWCPPSTVCCIRWSSENETWNSRPSTAAVRKSWSSTSKFYVLIKGTTVSHMHNFVYAFILLHPFHMQLTKEQSSPATSCVLTAYRTMSIIQNNVGGSNNIIQV